MGAKKGKRKQVKHSGGRMALPLLILLLVLLLFQLYHLFQELRMARSEELSYAAQLAELQETNRRLEDDIANRDDLGLIEDIARDELGMAAPGEKIFRFSNT